MKNFPKPNTRLNSKEGKKAVQTNTCSFVNKIKLDSPNKRKKFHTSNEDKICRIQHRSKTIQDIRDYFKQQKILPNIGEQTQNDNSSEISFEGSSASSTIYNIGPYSDQISMYPNHASHNFFHEDDDTDTERSELIPDNNLDFCSQNLINESNSPPSVDSWDCSDIHTLSDDFCCG